MSRDAGMRPRARTERCARELSSPPHCGDAWPIADMAAQRAVVLDSGGEARRDDQELGTSVVLPTRLGAVVIDGKGRAEAMRHQPAAVDAEAFEVLADGGRARERELCILGGQADVVRVALD